MEELESVITSSIAVPWAIAFLTGAFLLRQNKGNRNPLEWSIVDRCLLLIALFCFAGGAVIPRLRSHGKNPVPYV